MPKFLLLLCLACAHATEPVSGAQSLDVLFSGPNATSHTPNCNALKIVGEISDADDFVAAMAACADRPVVLEINSPGGNVFAALEIQKAIERHPHPVLCVVDGLAASAAFTTLQSCNIRLMTDRSLLMMHKASMPARGQSEQHENAVAALHELDRGMVLHVSRRLGLEPDFVEAKINGGHEWWMGLESALSFRAVDARVDSIAEAVTLAAGASK